MRVKIGLIGFGHVGKAFAKLLEEKKDRLNSTLDRHFAISGIATASQGIAIDHDGIDMQAAMVLSQQGKPISALSKLTNIESTTEFIKALEADVLIEISSVSYADGQPALGYIRAALEEGMHVVTANKGPVVFAHRELQKLAGERQRQFLFESTVMDGAPIFSLYREGLPATDIRSIVGVLNSTSNLILQRMENGESLEKATAYAQSIGIAESDPSGDIEGWDAAIKLCILANVMMGANLRPKDIQRKGIEAMTLEQIKSAKAKNLRWKLICRAEKHGTAIRASVGPQALSAEDALYNVEGTSSIVSIESDVLGQLTIMEKDPGPETTAYGLLADVINAVK